MKLAEVFGFKKPNMCTACGKLAKQVGTIKKKDGKQHPVYTCITRECPNNKARKRWTR